MLRTRKACRPKSACNRNNFEVGTFSTQILWDLGYQTTWAIAGSKALRLLNEGNKYDAVLMPCMSGIELAEEIRCLYPELPTVLTSGYSDVLAEEGRHGFVLLQKPYATD
jgi:CheY-like chemotaxis protein